MSQWLYPTLIGHRGAGKLVPENTLSSIRFSAAHGYRMVEFDVKLSSDGVLFLLHDDTLERTTNGKGRAAGKTWHELSQLDAGGWHSPRYLGEPMPTFAAVSAFCKTNGVAINAEIKACPGRERETGAAVALEAKVAWAGSECPPLLSSFSEVSLEAARDAAPTLPRALLFDELPVDWLDRCLRLNCVALDANWRTLTPDIVKIAHASNLRVVCYTCNDPEAVQQLVRLGVDSIITDAVTVLTP